jgi:hypothetical protein
MENTILDRFCEKNNYHIKYETIADPDTKNLFIEINIKDEKDNLIWSDMFELGKYIFDDDFVYGNMIQFLRQEKLNKLLNEKEE